ncbi:Inner membrane ABC transporter permease protein YcjO [archaeon HR06]|nr:Inner membrane ABC transporter permease protein YcjO [archaeon HR06]
MQRSSGKMVKWRYNFSTLLFFLPVIIYLFVFLWYPFIFGVWMSFHKWIYIIVQEPTFIGLTNYIELFRSPIFQEALRVTAIYVTATAIQLFLGLLAALVLNEPIKGKSVIAGLLIVGYAMPEMATGGVWKFMYDANFGILNVFLYDIGVIDRFIPWLTDPNFAVWAITLANAWKFWPFVFLILLAALQGIPKDFYDAAKVFGANAWQRFLYVTLPQLKTAIVVVLIIRIAWNLSKFAEIFMMTEGGPGFATTNTALFIYRRAYQAFQFGEAFAAGVILLAIIVPLVFLYYKVMVKK